METQLLQHIKRPTSNRNDKWIPNIMKMNRLHNHKRMKTMTVALCASASHIMTLTLAYIWLRCIISSVSICWILMLIASHTEYRVQYTFNILLFRTFSLLIFAFVYCVSMVFVLCVCGGVRAADSFLWQWHHEHHHVCTAQLKCSILLGHCMHPHLLFVCTSYAGISASRKHISKLSKQTHPHPHFSKQRKR